MVYRGRLGKGCAECRAKKTRCDAARPSCGQCKRAGRKCSGYRDLDALRVVDQTTHVRQKSSRKTKAPGDTANIVTSPDSGDSGYAGSSSSPANSTSSQEDLLEAVSGVRSFTNPHFWTSQEASFLFFDQFISVASAHPKTELDFVALLYGDVPSHGMLASMVTALGLMALPPHSRTRSHVMFANEQYVSAVRETQKALQDPDRATSDETLATVLLLGLHEFVDTEEPQFTTSRLSMHLEGSIKLLQLRGDSGMDHMSGTRMFHRICSQVILGCMHRRQRIPKALLMFANSMHKHLHTEEMLALELLTIAAQLCEVLASTTVVEPAEAVDHFNVLMSLEEQLAAWEQRISFRYHCRREPLHNPESVKRIPLRHQDTYFNHIAASCVNRYRSVRIVVNEEMIRLSEMVPDLITAAGIGLDQQCQLASITIAKMSEDIAYSLPFFFGEEACHLDVSQQDESSNKPRAGMHAATVTLMPLYYACNSKRVSPDMYRWLMRYLNWIGQSLGIGRANVLYQERQLLEDLG